MPNYYAAASNPSYYSYYQQLLSGMGVRPGDWLCASCNELNFASRRVLLLFFILYSLFFILYSLFFIIYYIRIMDELILYLFL